MAQEVPLRLGVTGTVDIVLTRDTVFPVWADTDFGFSAGTMDPWVYQMAWRNDEHVQTENVVAPAYESRDFDCTEVISVTTSGTGDESPYSFGVVAEDCPVGAVAAIMPEVDSKPWLWAPHDATIVWGFSIGAEVNAASPAGSVTVTYEYATGPEELLGEKSVFFPAGIAGGFSTASYKLTVAAPTSGSKGIWLRPKRFNISKGAGATTIFCNDPWTPYVTVAIIGGANAGVTVGLSDADPNLPFITTTPGSFIRTFMPLVNADIGRSEVTSSASVVARSNRCIGNQLTIMNTTSVLNVEGEMICVCYQEGNKGSATRVPTASVQNTIVPVEKMTARLGSTVSGFARPGGEIEKFQDSRFEFGFSPTVVKYLSVINLYKVASYSLFSCRDLNAATATSLLLSLRTAVEFHTSDVLLRPAYAGGTMYDLQLACNATHKLRPFRIVQENQTNRIVDRRPLRVPRTAGRRQAQRPKPPAKPSKGKGGKGRGQQAPRNPQGGRGRPQSKPRAVLMIKG